MSKLRGKVAVITGGSSGIGLATAQRFVREGAYVFITGRRQAELDKAKALIGDGVTTIHGDISDFADLDRLFAQVKAEKGYIDILVANAGHVERATLEQSTPEHFDKLFDINVRGTYFTVQKALPLLREGASIVLVASALHLKGRQGMAVYSAAKAALRSLSRTWAAELKDRHIRVNTLSPGGTETPMLDGLIGDTTAEIDAGKEAMASGIPLGRIAVPDELARAVLFLASSDSSFSTGIDLVADGGFSQL